MLDNKVTDWLQSVVMALPAGLCADPEKGLAAALLAKPSKFLAPPSPSAGLSAGQGRAGRMATKRSKCKSGKSRRLTAAGYTGEGRNMRSMARGTSSRFPTLYYGDNGRVLPCLETLSFLDYYSPDEVATYDRDRWRPITDHSRRICEVAPGWAC